MHQNDGAGDVPGFGKVFFGSFRDINHRDVSVRRQCRSPGNGNRPQDELFRGNYRHASCAFGPRCLDGEIFCMDAVGPSGFERRDAPRNRFLHGGRAGDAASNLVRELLQVGFQG